MPKKAVPMCATGPATAQDTIYALLAFCGSEIMLSAVGLPSTAPRREVDLDV